jgi:hypothetical protein
MVLQASRVLRDLLAAGLSRPVRGIFRRPPLEVLQHFNARHVLRALF